MSTEDVLRPEGGGSRKKRRKRRRKLSPALRRVASRALEASDDDVRTYIPTELDLQIAEAQLAGALSFEEISRSVGCSPSAVSRAMRDPVRCAWISHQLHRIVSKRIGLVDVALFGQAAAGNVPAMKLYYERFGELIKRAIVLHGNAGFDPTTLSDADLRAILSAEEAKHATDADFTVQEDSEDEQ